MSTNDKLADALVQVPREALELIANSLPLKHNTMPYAMEALGFAQSEAREALAAHAASLAAPPAQGEWQPIDGTDAEVLREFIRVCRDEKPVGAWPGERVCAAIERAMKNERPFRFIAEADMAPERGHNGRGGDSDRPYSGPRRASPQPAPAPVQVDVLGELADEIEATYPNADASNLRAFAADAQPPAPGEVELPDAVVALRRFYSAYVRVLHAGRARILDLGGECDPVEQMEVTDPELVQARAAITALAQQRVPDAIDLAQFRPAVRVWKQDCAAWGDNEGEAMADRLLALIDQQQEARGNGE